MAIASAKAAPSNIGTNNLSEASGLRPIASMAFDTIFPIERAGKIPPIAMVTPFTINLRDSASIDLCVFRSTGFWGLGLTSPLNRLGMSLARDLGEIEPHLIPNERPVFQHYNH